MRCKIPLRGVDVYMDEFLKGHPSGTDWEYYPIAIFKSAYDLKSVQAVEAEILRVRGVDLLAEFVIAVFNPKGKEEPESLILFTDENLHTEEDTPKNEPVAIFDGKGNLLEFEETAH